MDDSKEKIKTLLTLFLVSRQLYTSPYKGSKLWEALKPTLTTQILKKKNSTQFQIYKRYIFSSKSNTARLTPNQNITFSSMYKIEKAWGKDRYNQKRRKKKTP